MYVGLWPWKSRVVAFARKREITGEPLNSRSQILAPNRREITGVNCIFLSFRYANYMLISYYAYKKKVPHGYRRGNQA